MNVTKINLTRCQIFHLKCTKFNFGLPRPPIWIWGQRENEVGKGGKKKRTGGERKGEGEEREGKGRGKDDSWSLWDRRP